MREALTKLAARARTFSGECSDPSPVEFNHRMTKAVWSAISRPGVRVRSPPPILAWISHHSCAVARNPLPPQPVAAAVSTRCCRTLLKASPERDRRKSVVSKPEGRISRHFGEKCGLGATGPNSRTFGELDPSSFSGKLHRVAQKRTSSRELLAISYEMGTAPLRAGGPEGRPPQPRLCSTGALLSLG